MSSLPARLVYIVLGAVPCMEHVVIENLPPAISPAGRVLRPGVAGLLLFVLSVVLSAALLFAVEPMFTRMVLPRFGGSASVWSVAIVFFQGTLLVGYAYAHLLTRHLPARFVALTHVAVLAAGLAFLPPQPLFGQTDGSDEIVRLLIVFALSIGAPFAALSANAPLLQSCFARSGLPGAINPYPLYAASNAGSLGALLAYPLLVEPLLTLREQAIAWGAAYGLLLFLMLLVGVAMLRAPEPVEPTAIAGRRSPPGEMARWIGLALVPSAALVAVTAHLSTDIAAAPFLWVAPLALYLFTFIIAFGASGSGWLRPLGLLLVPVLLALAVLLTFEIRTRPLLDVVVHLGVFFLLSLYCHGRLAEVRPEPARLTSFYLSMSLGGVIGGVLAAIVAPNLFTFVAEYPIVLALGALCLPRYGLPLATALVALLAFGRLAPLDVRERATFRSFYGVHTIETTADGRFRTLRHGVEVHGAQRLTDDSGRPVRGAPLPLTYYYEDSPISEAIDAARAKVGRDIRLGVVGLGTGSIACLAEQTDRVHFYEIDPQVIHIARQSGKFGFLAACTPRAEIIPGDARLSLAARGETYDILILDAFSSDSIPVHLLTREALAGYMDRLTPDGLLVLHISNNHLRLQEVVAATAASLGLSVRLHDEDQPINAPEMTIQPTVAAIARKRDDFGPLNANDEWVAPTGPLPRAWTDDYANPLGAFLANLR